VLLDRRLGHDQVGCDLARCGGRDEGLVGQGWLAERGDDVHLTPGQLRYRRPAQAHLGKHGLGGQACDLAALRAEG